MAVDFRTRLRRKRLAWQRNAREARIIARGLADTDHPVLAHLIPMRRCNLSCEYCNEYDQVSPPVPIETLKHRVDRLAALGVSIITMSGGEPMMHPELDELIRHIRGRGITASLITNGYYMVPDRIKKLNEAGLEYVQISIDNIQPDEISKKSLKVLDQKLAWMSEFADFDVNINSVVGAGVKNPEDACVIAERALELGFTSTIGIIHDDSGQLQPLGNRERNVYQRIKALSKRSYARMTFFQDNIAAGKPNNWKCRAGARYVYICEDGLVHYCSQQRGKPGIPLDDYTVEHIRRAYLTKKECAPKCTVSCVHKVSAMDFWRDPQTAEPPQVDSAPLVQLQLGE